MNEDLQKARLAIDREDYELAGALLLPSAEAGVAEAQYLLGYLYFTSAEVDAGQSRIWLERAAAQDHPEALSYLARWADDGIIGPPSEESRRLLLIRAAELGSVAAQREVGCCYAWGEGGWPLDLVQSRYWYGRAAEGGHADAQCNYGYMLLYGEGGPEGPAAGREWIVRAAERGDREARRYLQSESIDISSP